MMSMLNTLINQGKPQRQVVFLHAVRNGKVHAMKDHLSQVIAQNPKVSKAVYYEQVDPTHDVKGKDYDYQGRIDLTQIKEKAVLPNADYYLCGPKPFMDVQQTSLESMGVPKDHIHSEIFGSAS